MELFQNVSLKKLTTKKVLGSGFYGTVLECEYQSRTLAVKIIPRMRLFGYNGLLDRLMVNAIVQEKLALESLPPSPYLVKYYGTSADDNYLYFFFEMLGGGCLYSQIYNDDNCFLQPELSFIKFHMACIVCALKDLHSFGMAYRDLKPTNVLIDSTKRYSRLIDFGFTKKITDRSWTVCGTPYYIAPEILSCTGHNESCDWWSLGIMLYEMLFGRPAFMGASQLETFSLVLTGELSFPRRLEPEVHDVLMSLLTRNRMRRLGSGPRGVQMIRAHAFFRGVDWKAYESQEQPAPEFHHSERVEESPIDLQSFGEGSGEWLIDTELAQFRP